MGVLLIIFGIASLSFAVNSGFYLLIGIVLIAWGVVTINAKKGKGGGTGKVDGGNISESYGEVDYRDSNYSSGSGSPVGANTSRGYVNFSDGNWRTEYDGSMRNYVTGETVEKDIFGNYRFGDDDCTSSGFYYSDNYGYYNMDYDD